jgi:hypothetical protein
VHDGLGARYDFAAVDRGDTDEHVAMMDATDAWPAVQAARAHRAASRSTRSRICRLTSFRLAVRGSASCTTCQWVGTL